MRAVLRVINEYAGQNNWCLISHARIAEEAEVSVSTVGRVLKYLVQDLQVVIKETTISRNGNKSCRYRIGWGNLELHVEAYEQELEEKKSASGKSGKVGVWKPEVLNDQLWLEIDLPDHKPAAVAAPVRKPAKPKVSAKPAPAVAEPAGNDSAAQAILEEYLPKQMAEELATLCTAEDARKRVVEFQYMKQQGQLDGVGALIFRIQKGYWPISKPVTWEQIEKRRRAEEDRRTRREAEDQESRRFQIISLGRREGRSNHDINRVLKRHQLATI